MRGDRLRIWIQKFKYDMAVQNVCNSIGFVDLTHTSARSAGPKAGSYRPPVVGMFKLSNKIGFVICLTEISLMSRLDKKENEMALA